MARRRVEAGDETRSRLPEDQPRSPEHIGCQARTPEIIEKGWPEGVAAPDFGWRPPVGPVASAEETVPLQASRARAPASIVRAPTSRVRAPATIVRAPATAVRAPATAVR